MLTRETRLLANKEEFASKLFEGEAIIVNLVTGVYYSMENVGAMFWQMVDKGCSLREIVAAIAARYDVSSEQAEADVEQSAAELLQENLVQVSDYTVPSKETHKVEPQPKLRYDPPTLNIYRDIAKLWAFDPPLPPSRRLPGKSHRTSYQVSLIR